MKDNLKWSTLLCLAHMISLFMKNKQPVEVHSQMCTVSYTWWNCSSRKTQFCQKSLIFPKRVLHWQTNFFGETFFADSYRTNCFRGWPPNRIRCTNVISKSVEVLRHSLVICLLNSFRISSHFHFERWTICTPNLQPTLPWNKILFLI